MYDIFLQISDFVGMTGVIIILIAYFLLSTERWDSQNIIFQLANFIGAWMILFSLFFHWNLSSVIIEIAWIIISAVGIFRILSQPKKVKEDV
jgi:membrane-bound ClpP family serine protease